MNVLAIGVFRQHFCARKYPSLDSSRKVSEKFGRIWPRATWKLGTKLFVTQPHNSSARACFLLAMYLQLRESLLNQSYGIVRFHTIYCGADFGISNCSSINSIVVLLEVASAYTQRQSRFVKLPNCWPTSVLTAFFLIFAFSMPKRPRRVWRLDHISQGLLDCPRI